MTTARPPKVFDCFGVAWEMDVLEWRLASLEDLVDVFVLVEAPVTHQGNPKPLHYEENVDRFARWADRIVHVVADLGAGKPWDRENAQRRAVREGLAEAQSGDIVIVSDVDEIPAPKTIAALRRSPPSQPVSLQMFGHKLCLDLREPEMTMGSFATLFRDLGDPQVLRDQAHENQLPMMPRAAWHLAWLFPEELLATKLKSFAHAEFNAATWRSAAHIRRCRDLGVDPVWGDLLRKVSIDDFPAPILEAGANDARLLAPKGSGTGSVVARAYALHVPLRHVLPARFLDAVPQWAWVPLMPLTGAYRALRRSTFPGRLKRAVGRVRGGGRRE